MKKKYWTAALAAALAVLGILFLLLKGDNPDEDSGIAEAVRRGVHPKVVDRLREEVRRGMPPELLNMLMEGASLETPEQFVRFGERAIELGLQSARERGASPEELARIRADLEEKLAELTKRVIFNDEERGARLRGETP